MQFKTQKQPSSLILEIEADTLAADLEETHQTLHNNLQEVQSCQKKYTGSKDVILDIGNKFWFQTWHFRTTRLSKKLNYKRKGPYAVSNFINKNAYKLDFPDTIWKHNFSHLSLLDRYTFPTSGQPPFDPQQTIVNHSNQWEVDRLLDCKRRYLKLHYLVQWTGYSYLRSS